MEKDRGSLTAAEWQVMECLWEAAPRTGREAVEWLEGRMGWNRSTTLTLLRRLEADGVSRNDPQGSYTGRPQQGDRPVQDADDL